MPPSASNEHSRSTGELDSTTAAASKLQKTPRRATGAGLGSEGDGVRLRAGHQRAPRYSSSPPNARGRQLSAAEERDLVVAAQRGARGAREELVERFMPLVAMTARLYRASQSVDQDELTQDGVVGLLRALDRFDPDRGSPFWAYASWWVRQAMQHLIAELGRPVVLSDRAMRQLTRVKHARSDHVRTHHRDPVDSELAERTGLASEHVSALVAADRKPRGMDAPLPGDDGRCETVGERVRDPAGEDGYDRAIRRTAVRDLGNMLGRLNDRERMVVRARFGIGGPVQTLAQVAGALGVSAERVRQIERRALETAA